RPGGEGSPPALPLALQEGLAVFATLTLRPSRRHRPLWPGTCGVGPGSGGASGERHRLTGSSNASGRDMDPQGNIGVADAPQDATRSRVELAIAIVIYAITEGVGGVPAWV